MAEELQQNNNNKTVPQKQIEPQTSSNKRIAKNALMLYIRMFMTMIVGLYTSRVVLATLGVEDYGIYGVVGSILAMIGFINASMSGGTSRFLTFELGRGDKKRLADTFSSALIVHLIIALLVFILAETVGLWFLCNKLVIPEGRMTAAHWVYQCSILSAMLGITQAPYNSCIIAHEKMNIYAYLEILNVILKLIIVYILVLGTFDKLILYSLLHLSVSVLIRILYRIYCIRNFEEAHFRWIWNKNLLKPMLAFSVQTVAAHGSYSLREQGNNFAINMLFGVVVNAAGGIATTINGIISHFSQNVITAFRPQIIKSYAKNDYENCNRLIIAASKYSTLLLLLIIIPFEFEAYKIISLWLGQVPEYAVIFNRLMMISLLTCITNPVYIGLTATGDIKTYSYIQASIYALCPFVVYIICLLFNVPYFAYIIVIIAQIITSVLVVVFYKNRVPEFSINRFMISIIVGILFPSSCAISACFTVVEFMRDSVLRLFVVTVINMIVLCSVSYFVLKKDERSSIRHFIIRRFKNKE